MRCALIYNPVAGQNRHKRSALLGEIQEKLVGLGHSVDLIPTTASGSAAAQARDAIANGAEIVFACGGDGTVHDVLQGYLSRENNSAVCMGILPMGSANALARHLGLSLDPMTAALQQIEGEAVTLPVGKLVASKFSRYFTVMAGMGSDGLLAYEVVAIHKSTLGRLAYYLHAARLFMTRPLSLFEVEYLDSASDALHTRRAVSVMAVRIHNLGGLFSHLIPRKESISSEHLRVILLTSPALLSLPLWFLFGWLRLHAWNPFLHSISVRRLVCRPLSDEPHFQADGEWLGRGQIELSLIPDALRLRLPAGSQTRIR